MRFAAIFASVVSLGFFAAAAPAPIQQATSHELVQRSTDVAARDVSARCLTGGCPGSGGSGGGDLISIIANIQVEISAATSAINNACNQGGVTVEILTPLIADLTVKINLLISAVVNANISILGLINISIGSLASVCASILIDIIVCLKTAISSCSDSKDLITAVVKIIVELVAKLNVCSKGISIVIGGLIKSHASDCQAIGLDVSIFGINVSL